MTIPFYDRTLLGYYAAGEQRHAVRVVQRGRSIQHVEIHTDEDSGDGSWAAWGARGRARTGLALPSDGVMLHRLAGPSLEEPELYASWLTHEIERQRPSFMPADAIVARPFVVEATPDQTHLWLALARRNAVEACVTAGEAEGLSVTTVGCLPIEVAYTVHAHSAAEEDAVAIAVTEAEAVTLVLVQAGEITAVIPLGDPEQQPEPELIAQLQHALEPYMAGDRASVRRLYFAGVADEQWRVALEAAGGVGIPVHTAVLKLGQPARTVSGPDLLALALALQAGQEAGTSLSFLSPAQALSAAQRVEQRSGLQVVAVGVMVLLLGLGGATAGHAYLNGWQQRVDDELSIYADEVAEVQAAKTTFATLKQEVAEAEQLATERTDTAQMMEAVGRQTPPLVWLHSYQFKPDRSQGRVVILEGFAFDEQAVARYMQQLEQLANITDAQLVYAERGQARRMVKYHEVDDERTLTRFEVQLHLDTTG
ncbi:MAG: PilN domain-containing protein [Bacteroidota bacterium]